jgi:hypothetical protein
VQLVPIGLSPGVVRDARQVSALRGASRLLVALAALAIAGCGNGSSGSTGSGGSTGGSAGSGAGGTGATGGTSSGGTSSGGSTTGGSAGSGAGGATGGTGGTGGGTTTGGSAGSGGSMEVTPDALLALTKSCTVASKSKYATDDGEPSTIDICKLNGAYFWNADMDVDCDGKTTPQCNINTDPAYQDQTSATDSNGDPLDAANLQYVVVPLPSARFSYTAADIHLGAVVAVLYKGQLQFGVFGDEGPDNIIGEASYAMAKSLGIDPDPSTGGTDSGVTYIVFTGKGAVVPKIEDHAGAVTLGNQLATTLLSSN